MAVKLQLLVFAAFLSSGCLTAQTTENNGSRLAAALKQHYKLAKSNLDTDGKLSFEHGTRLTVRKEGIMSFETTDTSIATLCPSRVEGGTVHVQSDLACTKLAPVKKQVFKLSETVCVTAIDVNSATDRLSMILVSCDPHDAIRESKTNRAVVLFVFPKGTLGKATPAKIEEVIGQTLSEGHSDASVKPASPTHAPALKESAVEGATGPGDEAKADADGRRENDDGSHAQAAAGQAASREDSPHGSSDAAPADDAVKVSQVGKGQTVEQVTVLLGVPLSITDLHDKILYLYPKVKVFFVDGIVTEVHQIGS